MLEIVTSWELDQKQKDIWCNAASTFRLPYWDWANPKRVGIPEIRNLDNIEVVMPSDGHQTIANPLWGFRNPKLDSSGNNVAMGDCSMGENAIEDDKDDPAHPLPVGVKSHIKASTQCF